MRVAVGCQGPSRNEQYWLVSRTNPAANISMMSSCRFSESSFNDVGLPGSVAHCIGPAQHAVVRGKPEHGCGMRQRLKRSTSPEHAFDRS